MRGHCLTLGASMPKAEGFLCVGAVMNLGRDPELGARGNDKVALFFFQEEFRNHVQPKGRTWQVRASFTIAVVVVRKKSFALNPSIRIMEAEARNSDPSPQQRREFGRGCHRGASASRGQRCALSHSRKQWYEVLPKLWAPCVNTSQRCP